MKSEEVNLTSYEPFREDTLAKSLDTESSLSLMDNLPRLDGATALYPLYSAFARATYPFAHYFYAITVVRQDITDDEEARVENTQKLIEWILSPQGQSLVEKTEYVPLR